MNFTLIAAVLSFFISTHSFAGVDVSNEKETVEERYKRKIKGYDRVIKFNRENREEDAEAFFSRGVLKAALERYEEAIVDLNEAIRIYPQYAAAFYQRGVVKAVLEKYEAAVLDFDEAIKINPQYAEAFELRGTVKAVLGQQEAAIKDFNEAMKIYSQE